MSMRTITKTEALQRAQDVQWHSMQVELDLADAQNLENAVFGSISTLVFTTATSSTFLDLIAQDVQAVTVNGEAVNYDYDGSRVILTDLPTGQALTVVVRCLCKYSRSGEGLHRYRDPEDGKVYLYTQYEPSDARRVYACFDQPGMKAPWQINVTAPTHWTVLSNQVAAHTEHHGQNQRVVFATTAKLSAYITAVIAGPYTRFAGGTWEGGASDGKHVHIDLGVYCRASLAPYCDADDIFHATRASLDFYHQNYGFTYPWGKYDQVFVPEYNLGAMENPGCVTFTEDYLYRDAPTPEQKQSRANTIFHEMCHMWFGDLVTPSWWDDLWLKESFADNQGSWGLVETGLYPQEWATFACGRKEWAYRQDQLPTTHPIAADIPDVEAAKHNFDGITYAKGAAVLKQLVAYVGPQAFFAGARQYFQDHAFSATSLPDFLRALESASKRDDLHHWQQAWLHTASPSRLKAQLVDNQDGTALHIHQHCVDAASGETVLRPHAIVVGLYALEAGKGRVWQSAVTIRDALTRIPLDPSSFAADATLAQVDFVLANEDDLTYAILELDDAQLAVATEHLRRVENPVSRAVAWSALWAAVTDGRLDPRQYLDAVIQHLPGETDGAVVTDILDRALVAIRRYLPGTDRQRWGTKLAVAAIGQISEVKQDTDAAKLWATKAVEVLSLLSDDEPDFTDFLEDLAATRSPLLEVGPTLAWRARTVLAARGRFSEDEIAAALQVDASGEAHVWATQARAAIPTRSARLRAWQRVVEEDLTNDELSSILKGLSLGGARAGVVGLAGEFFSHVDQYWQYHSIGMGRRFLFGAYPARVDLDYPQDAQAVLALAQAWLEARPRAPHALVRLMREGYDDLQRSYRLQKQWLNQQ